MIDQTSSNTEKVYVDAETGRRYSFNSMTGKSVWIDKNQEVGSKNIISMFQPKANTKKKKTVKGNATNTSKRASALNISTIRTVVSAANKLKKNSQRQRTISVGQKFKKAVKGIGRKIVQAELGTSTYGGDNVPLLVGDYLAGKTKFEMLNKLGSPVKIISSSNGETIYVYFFEDYSANNYPSVVGLMYVNSNDRIVSVQKEKTRLSLSEFLYFKNLN